MYLTVVVRQGRAKIRPKSGRLESPRKMDKCFANVRKEHGTYIRWLFKRKVVNRSNICYLICLRYVIRSRAITNWIFLSEKTYFLSCVRNMF